MEAGVEPGLPLLHPPQEAWRLKRLRITWEARNDSKSSTGPCRPQVLSIAPRRTATRSGDDGHRLCWTTTGGTQHGASDGPAETGLRFYSPCGIVSSYTCAHQCPPPLNRRGTFLPSQSLPSWRQG